MNPQEKTPELRTLAASMLPGMRHARALLDISIRVLGYFERYATGDVARGTATTFPPPEPGLQQEVENVRSMLSAFSQLHAARTAARGT